MSAYIGMGQGTPRGWIITADGKIGWSGNPKDLTDDKIEEWLKDCPSAEIDRDVAPKLRSAVKNYNNGKYGKALKEAAGYEQSEDESEQADAKFITEKIRKAIGWRKEAAERMRNDGEWVKLYELLTEDAKAYDDCEYGEACKKEAKDLKGEDRYKDAVAADKMLEKITDHLDRLKGEALNHELDKVIEKYPGTPAARKASELKQ
ncbi:MAG: hypothetical protein KDB82_03590 [Planctomycetes bacterium]|nr:hypothetical protein [Planctomycetota bacterium]